VGSAHVSEVSVRAEASSWGWPVSFALASANSAAVTDPSATGSPEAAAADTECKTPNPAANIPVTRVAEIIREPRHVRRPTEKPSLIFTQTPTVRFSRRPYRVRLHHGTTDLHISSHRQAMSHLTIKIQFAALDGHQARPDIFPAYQMMAATLRR
jgi:hypothetical protein